MQSTHVFRAGIDIGSTTVKMVLFDENGTIDFSDYRRHRAHTQEALAALLREIRRVYPGCGLSLSMTGSGTLSLSEALGVPFVQEVAAVASALKRNAPQTDVAIELGGEDAKIIYFTGGLEERMPIANNHLVELLEREGAEAVVPDLIDFFQYSLYNGKFRHEYIGKP